MFLSCSYTPPIMTLYRWLYRCRVRRCHLGLHIDLFRSIFYCHFLLNPSTPPPIGVIYGHSPLYKVGFPRDKPSISYFITYFVLPHIGTTFTTTPKTIRPAFFFISLSDYKLEGGRSLSHKSNTRKNDLSRYTID